MKVTIGKILPESSMPASSSKNITIVINAPPENNLNSTGAQPLTDSLNEAKENYVELNSYATALPQEVSNTLKNLEQKARDGMFVRNNSLNLLQRQVRDLDERMQRIEIEIIESANLQNDVEELRQLEEFKNKLAANVAELREEMRLQQQALADYRQQIQHKLDQIKEKKSEGLLLIEQINILKGQQQISKNHIFEKQRTMRSLSTNRLNSTNKGQASTGLSFFQAQAISKERKHTKTTTTATATTIRGDRLFSQTHFVTEYAGNTHSPQLNNPQQHHYLTDRFLGKTEQTQAFGVVGAATSQSRNNNNIFISTRTSQGTLEQPLQNQQLQDIVTMNAVAKAQIKLARELEQQNQQTIRHLNRRTMNFTLFKQLVLSSFSVLNKKLAKTHSIAKKKRSSQFSLL